MPFIPLTSLVLECDQYLVIYILSHFFLFIRVSII